MSKFFQVSALGLKPDLDKFTRLYERGLNKLWRGATRAFLETVVEDRLIAVETGMSKASLLPLARAVQMVTTVRATINPKLDRRRGLTTIDGVYHPDQWRSIDSGIEAGKDCYTLKYGDKFDPIYTFTFRINVFQFLLHENGVGGEAPRQALYHGQEAFYQYIKDHQDEAIPQLNSWLTLKGNA